MRLKFNDENLIKILVEEIPEFSKSIVPEFSFSAYIVYGDFGIYLCEKILKKPQEIGVIEKAFEVLNKLILEGDDDIRQMLRVTTFEILTDNEQTIETAKKYLNNKALQIFLDVIKLIKG